MSNHERCDCTVNDGHIVSCPLHSAAPELLEALEACAGLLADYGRRYGYSAALLVAKNARVAIRKATEP